MKRLLLAFTLLFMTHLNAQAQNTGISSEWWMQGTGAPSATCSASQNGGVLYTDISGPTLYQCLFYNGSWAWLQLTGRGLASGTYLFIKAGSCPTGYTEDDTLATYNILVTTTAAGDVGTTGGSNSYTPAGSATVSALTAAAQAFTGGTTTVPAETVNSLTAAAQTVSSLTAAAQTFTGSSTTVPAETVNSLTAAAQTFTGSSTTVPAETVNSLTAAAQAFTGASDTTSATTGGTPAGTNGATATTGNCAATNIAAGTGSTTACKATAPNLTVPAETFTGSQLATHTHTVTPTGTNGTSAVTGTLNSTTVTPLGANASSAVTGTLNSTTITPLGTNAGSAVTGTMNSSAVTGTLNSTTITPLGANAPSAVTGTLGFAGTPATITTPYFKMIACEKN